MARIKQLSSQEIQKIAAGEVVERPANIVKELIENALDAGATTITIYINDAGKSLIRIVDNGCGMSKEDAQFCFAHHATSKITGIADLATLNTFGFRGEALSSIAAVSKITLITKEKDAATATKVTLEQGIIITHEDISGNTGTDMQVADLFYNVPARKKFLKTNDTEWRQILLLFQALCLDYQQVHFKLFSQGTLFLNCPATTNLQERIAQIWDHTVAQQTIPINADHETFKVTGIISNHTYSRYDRSTLFFLVNNRWVKNYGLSKALLKGYLNVLPPDKFPLACIAITIDPSLIDVNIHPRKEEIQFLNPRIIENAIHDAAKQALENNLSKQLNKTVHFKGEEISSPIQPFETRFQRSSGRTEESAQFISNITPIIATDYGDQKVSSQNRSPNTYKATPLPLVLRSIEDASRRIECTIIGQFHKTYILIEQENSLYIIDQHAAHERILYEELAHRFENVATIQLMFPPIINLTPDELRLIEAHQKLFVQNNIMIETIGANQIMIQAVPAYLKEIAFEELIRQALGWIIEHNKLDAQELYKKVNEKLHAQMACKAAVKAGDVLTPSQMQQLLHDLQKTPNRFTCPHGRPTGWDISLYEIEKKFKRKV
jgi:DNA mismatch repair protein MutL